MLVTRDPNLIPLTHLVGDSGASLWVSRSRVYGQTAYQFWTCPAQPSCPADCQQRFGVPLYTMLFGATMEEMRVAYARICEPDCHIFAMPPYASIGTISPMADGPIGRALAEQIEFTVA